MNGPPRGARVSAEGLAFGYGEGGFTLRVERLAIEPGESLACIGPSGSGKSTLLSLVAGILLPTAGSLSVDGERWADLPDAERRRRRIARVGLVFQELELLEHLSVLENVLLPYLVSGSLRLDDAARERACDLARSSGIDRHLERKPRSLSQGERQRAAICRALVTRPPLLLADEPTGNLDPETSRRVVRLLVGQARERGATLVMVTHDHSLLDAFDRVMDVGELCAEAPA